MAQSLKKLRADPRFELVEKVETWSPFPPPGHRSDLLGIFDILALGPGITLGVQCTSVGGVSARIKKLKEHPSTRPALRAGWQIEIWGWHKPSNRWELGRWHRFELNEPGGTADG